jgi:hypothetical protein
LPIDTRARAGSSGSDAGFSGFSSNCTTRPRRSTASTPNWRASAIGTGRAAIVASAPDSWWNASIWFTSMR